jgi:tetratricopeptide (TPR) repeat protein
MLLLGAAGCQQELISHVDESRAQGIKLYGEQQYADAAGSFRNAIRQDPRDYRSQYYLGCSYEQLKQYQQAIQAYKASLDAQPRTLAGAEDEAQRVKTTDALAQCIAKSDNGDSETNLVEQQAKTSENARDYYLLAKIYQDRGDLDSALDSYNRASIIDPKDFQIQKGYGLVLEQAGQTAKAQQVLKRAYTMNDRDVQVQEALRRVGIIPGPALKDESALVPPPLPQGPLPEVDLSKFRISANGANDSSAPSAAPAASAEPSVTPPATVSPPPPAPATTARPAPAPAAPRD